MIWVGLTGAIASGKTTVANMFREHGVPIVDADHIAHEALRDNKDKIVEKLGAEILDSQGEIDRKLLGSIVFADPNKLLMLESLVHPYVKQRVEGLKSSYTKQGHKIAIYDVPLLFEKKLGDQFDQVILVYAPKELSIKRMMVRNSLTEEEALVRLKNQMDVEEKKKLTDIVIDNTGDLNSLKTQVDQVFNKLIKE